MTREQLACAVERWRLILIPEWRVVLMDERPPWEVDNDFHAVSQTSEDYTEIRVHFTDECLLRDDAQVEVTIAHELLHALTRPWRGITDRVAPYLPQFAIDQLEAERVHEEEKLVDRLSRVLIAQLGPAPLDGHEVGPGTVSGPATPSTGRETTQGRGATPFVGKRHRAGAGISGCTGLGSSHAGPSTGEQD
jgi:hypothetical protein